MLWRSLSPTSLLKEAHELWTLATLSSLTKGSLQLEGTETESVVAHLHWQNLANVTWESVNMSTIAESSNKQHATSNPSTCVSVFSLNIDVTWLTTSACSWEWNGWCCLHHNNNAQEAPLAVTSVMAGTRGNFDPRTSVPCCYTLQQFCLQWH